MTPSQQAPSLVERLLSGDPKAIYRTRSVALFEEAAARITELEQDFKAALREVSQYAREAGEAKGRLEMSEAAGIVDGWRERAERAEAQCRVLSEALQGARETILDLKNARWSECEGDDADWVREIDNALSLSGGGGAGEFAENANQGLPESPSADAAYPRSHEDQRSDGGRG